MVEDDVKLKPYAPASPFLQRATSARKLVQAYQHAFAKQQYPNESRRLRLCLTLFAMSIAHAYTIAKLVELHVEDHGSSALALLRPQVDAMLRGILFATLEKTSDADVDQFIDHDRLPKIGKGKQRHTISFLEMAAIATPHLAKKKALDDPDRLRRLIERAADLMHGFTHGGRVMFRLHGARPGHVEFALSDEALDWLLRNSAMMAAIPWVLSPDLLGAADFQVTAEVAKAEAEFFKAFGINAARQE